LYLHYYRVVLFDNKTEFCDAKLMVFKTNKFVILILAFWLPLFSGNALAASIVMQITAVDCHTIAGLSNEQHMHQVSASHHHDQIVAGQDMHAIQYDHQTSTCNNCSVCHFACSVFIDTVAVNVTADHQIAQNYPITTTQFKSLTYAPLLPPPLYRV